MRVNLTIAEAMIDRNRIPQARVLFLTRRPLTGAGTPRSRCTTEMSEG
jgi:hypothetical protein